MLAWSWTHPASWRSRMRNRRMGRPRTATTRQTDGTTTRTERGKRSETTRTERGKRLALTPGGGSADALPACSPEHEVDLCEDGDGDLDVENPAGVTVISKPLVRGDVRLRGGRLVVNSARTLTVQGAVDVGATSTLDVRGTLTYGACSVAAGATILGSFVCP